jgi:hypothetical protein
MSLFESIQVDKVGWNGDNKLCIRLKRVIGYLCVANGTKWMGGAIYLGLVYEMSNVNK